MTILVMYNICTQFYSVSLFFVRVSIPFYQQLPNPSQTSHPSPFRLSIPTPPLVPGSVRFGTLFRILPKQGHACLCCPVRTPPRPDRRESLPGVHLDVVPTEKETTKVQTDGTGSTDEKSLGLQHPSGEGKETVVLETSTEDGTELT